MKVISRCGGAKNAGSKAPSDVNEILKKYYNAEIYGYNGNALKRILKFINFSFKRDILLVQYPLFDKKQLNVLYKLLPKKRTIYLIHDIDGLRQLDINKRNKEIKFIKKYMKHVIVHNNKMKNFLIENGVNKNNIYVLELFDYLTDDLLDTNINKLNKVVNVCYTGNLIQSKCPIIYQIEDSKLKFNLKLYGIGIDKDFSEHVTYHGSFEPNHINVIDGDLGLVWDGNIDESDSDVPPKSYTKYNNPHKLSCYIARGIVPIVWGKSAVADFVNKYNIGYTINNIYDINKLNFKDYEIKKKNVLKLSKKVREGLFTKTVVDKVLSDIKYKRK